MTHSFFIHKVFGRNTSLRTVLIILFVVQICVVVGLTGYISFLNGQKAVNDLAGQLQGEVAARIQQHLRSYLEIPHLINQSHLNAIEVNLLDLTNPVTLGRYFWKQLQDFSSVSTLYFGNPQGGIILAGRQVDGSFAIEETKDFVAGDYFIYSTDDSGNRTNLIRIAPPFDSRIRPWYKVAIEAGKAAWSEVFFIYARENLGIAASLPVYNKNKELQGVLTTQLVVSQIADFLQSLTIGRSGQAFIVERSGLIVASSTDEKPFVFDSQNVPARLNALNSQVPLIRFAEQHLVEKFSSLYSINNNQQMSFTLNGQRQYLQVSPLRDERGLDWLIVIAVPEADFMERINANTRMTIFLSFAALCVAIWIGIIISRWIIHPILNLTHAATRFAQGEWHQTLSITRADELGVLGDSFNRMVQQLKESFTALAEKNKEINQLNADLEQRVIERTAALNAKVEELVQTRNELLQSEKMASLGRLVAGFAHEINTPIGVAVGAASTLQEIAQTVTRMTQQEEVDEEELLSTLESVNEAAELTLSNLRRAVRLVSSFKRTAIDQSSDTSRMFNVRETIEDVNNSLHSKFKHTDIKISINCLPTIVLYGLPGVLDQILTNFMMNSLFHGFNDGKLGGQIIINVTFVEPSKHLRLEYIDTGKGMEQSVVEKIFEPFFTTRRAHGGTGLGLYICYNLVTSQLHGTIICESQPGKGVRFLIEYPAQTSAILPSH